MRTIPIVVLAAAGLVLAGCSTGAPTPSGTTAAPDETGATGTGDLARCLDGDWDLDVDHLADQLAAVAGLSGVPVAELAVRGDGELEFDDDDDDEVDGDLDLRVTGELEDGTPFDIAVDVDFEGDWAPGDEPGTISIERWDYDVDSPAGTAGVDLPRPMDFSDLPTIRADCSDDVLVLGAGEGPLEVRWLRDR